MEGRAHAGADCRRWGAQGANHAGRQAADARHASNRAAKQRPSAVRHEHLPHQGRRPTASSAHRSAKLGHDQRSGSRASKEHAARVIKLRTFTLRGVIIVRTVSVLSETEVFNSEHPKRPRMLTMNFTPILPETGFVRLPQICP